MVACSGGKGQEGQKATTQTTTAQADTSTTVNASIKVDYMNRYLGLHRAVKVNASVIVPKGEQYVSKQLTWTSSDDSIVQVTQKGWLQAQGKAGTAMVEIRADNGATKTLNITVDDFANPTAFSNLDQIRKVSAKAADIIVKYKDPMCKVATYLEKYKYTADTLVSYYNQGIQVDGDSFSTKPIESQLVSLTKDAGMTISIDGEFMTFGFTCNDNDYIVVYSDRNSGSNANLGVIKMAPCWWFCDQIGY